MRSRESGPLPTAIVFANEANFLGSSRQKGVSGGFINDRSIARLVVCLSVLAWAAFAQQASDEDVYRIGSGVTSPKLLYKQEPTYSRSALNAGIQGIVLLQIVIDEQGAPHDIDVLSPLGFGLDEQAVSAVSSWRFRPGEKDGKPVKVRATVEVSFRLLGKSYDEKAERRRTQFNAIVSRLSKIPGAMPTEKDVASMEDLAKQKMPAALYALGLWQTNGNGVPKDATQGLANIQKAADQKYGAALYYVGQMTMPHDAAKGLAQIREAAELGSKAAQFMLGDLYEVGKGVPPDTAKAKRYFRLCAAAAVPQCEQRLGRLLVSAQQTKESDRIQGIAWLQLASGHGVESAKELADSEEAKLTPQQSSWVQTLRGQLERKQ